MTATPTIYSTFLQTLPRWAPSRLGAGSTTSTSRAGGSTSWPRSRSSARSATSSTRRAIPTGSFARPSQPTLELLQERGLLLELPAVFPDHLDDVPELARRYPALTLVVDHLGKPPIGRPEMSTWQAQLEHAAACTNVVAKVSGLNTLVPRPDWDAGDLEPAVRAAFDLFGSERLLFGSDWPVALLNGTYEHVVSETTNAIRSVARDGAEAILGGNAVRLYAIDLT